ncbi:MAG: hypothetical protein JWM64_1009 [Frankiales bacterium]|nr:hypothetical protein [Frankiales bacterium]
MVFAFLSARLRRWVLLVVVLPLVGRVLQGVGVRLPGRTGAAVGRTGGLLRGRQTRRRPR